MEGAAEDVSLSLLLSPARSPSILDQIESAGKEMHGRHFCCSRMPSAKLTALVASNACFSLRS